jgi:hypothetical protein
MPSPVFTVRAAREATVLALLLAAGGLAGAGCSGPGARRARDGKAPAGPSASEARRVEVPGRGALVLEVPAGWTVETSPGLDPSLPEVIRLEPPGGTAQVLLSPMVIGEPEDAGEPGEAARLFTMMARRKALGTEGEAAAPIQELEGASGPGYWFVATDPTPPPPPDARAPHAWRHLLRGAVAVGRIVLTFTLLDDRAGPEREALLAMVRAARSAGPDGRAGPGSPEAAAPADGSGEPGALRFEPDPDALTEPLEVVPPGAPFTVLVDLPGFSMFRPRSPEDGEGVLVLGQDPHGLVASVTVADAAGAGDARACRAAKLERIRASAAELHELAEADADAGAAARASYTLEELRGRPIRQRHAHAFFERDGACVDVHVSKADPAPEDAERIESILSSVRFGERL